MKGTIRNAIEAIFLLESFPGGTTDFKILSFTDDDGIVKFINAKVFSLADFDQTGRAAAVIPFTIELFAEDPFIRSPLTANSVTMNYGLYGGFTLPFNAPFDLNKFIGAQSAVFGGMEVPFTAPVALDETIPADIINNTGTMSAGLTLTVTGEITNPKILNLTTGKFWKQNITMTASDVLIIDTDATTAELNGVNDLANRATGSDWLFIDPGVNDIVLVGDDFDWDDQEKATLKVEWFDTYL